MREQIEQISIYDFDGPIDKVIERLQQLRADHGPVILDVDTEIERGIHEPYEVTVIRVRAQ